MMNVYNIRNLANFIIHLQLANPLNLSIIRQEASNSEQGIRKRCCCGMENIDICRSFKHGLKMCS